MQEKTLKAIKDLPIIAEKIRLNTIESIYKASSGHPGGSLSIAEILSVLYFSEMRINPKDPKAKNRDRLILSKGHAAPALYSALALRGYFSADHLLTLRRVNSILQGHPDINKTPGIDMVSGSLGQGLSIASGMALYSKTSGAGFRVYCILGDGELQEGQIWEAAMSASHYKLDNLTVFIDNNNLQLDGAVSEIMNPYPIEAKFQSFGFNTLNIDAHNIKEITEAIAAAKKYRNKPTAIIAKSVKGKGVSFMENKASWHGGSPTKDQYLLACKEIEDRIANMERIANE